MTFETVEPLISIVLPVYNGEDYLGGALRSIVEQSFRNWELIVVDDGSADNSYSIALSASRADPRITVLRNGTNLMLPETLNVGFRQSVGDLLTWTSHDNLMMPEFLQKMKDGIVRSGADFVFSDYDVFVDSESVEGARRVQVGQPEELVVGNVIGPSFLYTRAVAEVIGDYSPEMFLYEDYDYWLRVHAAGFRMIRLGFSGYLYRQHERQLSVTHNIPEGLFELRKNVVSSWQGSRKYVPRAELNVIAECFRRSDHEGALRLFFQAVRSHPAAIIATGLRILFGRLRNLGSREY